MKTIRKKAYLALLINSILWGLSSPIIKNALNYTTPLYFLTYRFIIVFLLVTPFFLVYLAKSKHKLKNIPKLLFIGLFSNPFNLFLLFIGLSMTSALNASVLTSLVPIFFAITGHLLLKEKITRQEKIGIGTAVTGTLIFTLQPIFNNTHSSSSSIIGNFIIIFAHFFYIAAMIMAKKEKQANPPFVQAYFGWLTALLFFLPLSLLTNTIKLASFWQIWQNPALPNIIYMAVFGSIVAFFAYLYGQSKIETSEASVFTYLQPLFAAPLAVFWLGEQIKTPFIIGCSLIVVGVILSETRIKILAKKRKIDKLSAPTSSIN